MGCFEVYPSTCFGDGGAAQSITARLKNTYCCCLCVWVCVCPHLAAWLHMLSTLAIKVESCALCSYYVLLQNIKMISSSILPFYLKKKMSELLTCSLIISYICILCMAFLTNFLFFHSIYLFTGFQLLLHTSYVVCVLRPETNRVMSNNWMPAVATASKTKNFYKCLCERRIYLINFQSFNLQIFDSLTFKSQSDFKTQFILSL